MKNTVFPFMSSHPARKAITLQFVVKNLNISIDLEGPVLDSVVRFAKLSIENYQPWILRCFEPTTDQDYRCKKCDKNITPDPSDPDNRSIIDAARNHLFKEHPKYFKTKKRG